MTTHHTYVSRVPVACPDPSAYAMTVMRAQVEASGGLVQNLDALTAEVSPGDEGFYSVVIAGIEVAPNPAWDEPCEFCDEVESGAG